MRTLQVALLTNLVVEVVLSSEMLRHCAEEPISTCDLPDIGETVREIDALELSPVESLIFCDWLMTRKILPFDQSRPVEFLRDSFLKGRVVKEVTWTGESVSFLTKQVDVLTEFVRLTRSPLIGPTIEDTFDIMVVIRSKQSMDQTTNYKIQAILNLMWRNLFFDLFLKRSPMNFKTISESMQRSPVAAQPRTLDDIEKDLEGRYSQGDVLLGRFLGNSIEFSFRQFIRIASNYPYVLGSKEELWAQMHPFHPIEPFSTKICGTSFFFGDPPRLSRAQIALWAFELLDKSFEKTPAERDLLCSWVQDAQKLGSDFDDLGWDAIKAKLEHLEALIYFREASPKVHQLCGGFTRLLSKESARILEESVQSWGSDLCVYIGFWNSHAIQEEDELLRWVGKGVRSPALHTGSAGRLSPHD